jgi:hypothetical protein
MRRVLVALCLLLTLAALSWLPGPAGAGVTVKSGSYSGRTTQVAVNPPFRRLQFRLSRKRKVTLTTEPTVAKGLCLSTPVFTLEGTPTKRLNSRGAFSFTRTFVGSKFDRISGRFVSPTEVEGFVVYHFQAQDLCAGGKIKVRFSAKRA